MPKVKIDNRKLYVFREGNFMKSKTHVLVAALFPTTNPQALGKLVKAQKKYRHSSPEERRMLEPIITKEIDQVRLSQNIQT
jgi:hypothetical protein